MPILLPLASGKGGVGKSAVAANLAWQLSQAGKTIILVDLDWGGSNAHTMLGLKNNHPGMDLFIKDKTVHLDQLVVPLDDSHLFFIPGDGLVPGTANMPFIRKQRLIKELKTLTADYVILDMGAGTHFNTVDVFLACGMGLVMTTPEPTSILNAYSFLKTALYRLLRSAVATKHPARPIINDFFAGRIESVTPDKHALATMLGQIEALDPETARHLQELHGRFMPRIIVNMGKEVQELSQGGRLRQICSRHLGINIEYIAYIPWDDEVRKSIMNRSLLSKSLPDSSFSKAIAGVSMRILNISKSA